MPLVRSYMKTRTTLDISYDGISSLHCVKNGPETVIQI